MRGCPRCKRTERPRLWPPAAKPPGRAARCDVASAAFAGYEFRCSWSRHGPPSLGVWQQPQPACTSCKDRPLSDAPLRSASVVAVMRLSPQDAAWWHPRAARVRQQRNHEVAFSTSTNVRTLDPRVNSKYVDLGTRDLPKACLAAWYGTVARTLHSLFHGLPGAVWLHRCAVDSRREGHVLLPMGRTGCTGHLPCCHVPEHDRSGLMSRAVYKACRWHSHSNEQTAVRRVFFCRAWTQLGT